MGGKTTIDVSSTTAGRTIPDRGSPYAIVLRNAAGKVLSRTPVALQPSHGDGHGGPIPFSLIEAVVPARSAGSLQITDHGHVIQRLRSRPFKLRVRFPRRVAGKRVSIHVRLTGSGAAAAKLAIFYAADGKHFKLVDFGVSGPVVTIPRSLLPRSRRGRLRILADDGFRERTATSRRLNVP